MSCCQAAQTFPSGCACETSDAVSLMRSEIARIPLRRLSLAWYFADFLSFPYSSLSSAPAAQTPVGSGQVLQGCANFNLDRNRNMPDHGLLPKASRQQEPRLPSQALTQGCISLLPYQLNNVKLHYLVVRNEALHSGEGVPGADCTAARTIGSYKSQAGREIILGSSSFGLGSHLQHTTAAVLRQSPPGRTLGLSRLRVRPGMYETDRRLDCEEFLQERATATLKRSITLLQLRVFRLPREWSGLWPWVPATLNGGDQAAEVDPSETDFLPAQQCCPHAAHARS